MSAQGDVGGAEQEWLAAGTDGRTAVAGLTIARPGGPPVLLDPAAVVDAFQVQGRALQRLRGLPGREAARDEQAELELRLASLPAIAQRFTACGSPSQRQVLDQLYRPWLVETVELAVALHHTDGTDITAEVLRRDLLGSVLYAIAADPMAPEQIAELARRLTAALSARAADTTESSDPADPGSAGSHRDGGDIDAATRAGNIAEQVDQALDVVGGVLGPVARTLFDPRTITAHTARTVAERLYPDRAGAVLSLLLVDRAGRPRVVRRLCWRTGRGEPLRDAVDIVAAPDWLVGLSTEGDQDEFFARIGLLTEVLLPRPLLDVLTHTDPERPLPLAVVPTGLLAVPIAALPLADELVIDRAVVSVAQSLQALDTLAAATRSETDEALKIAVYDTANLKYAGYEWQELRRHHPAARPARTLREIDQLLADAAVQSAPGLLALAIHGARGLDGWTQAKQLPSGERITTGHVLQWYVPALVVGASCNTDIRSDAGGELGGFPLAFQLRGAINIVGALHYIEDQSTAEIMSRFYAATANGMPTAAALRHAQREWTSEDRRTRLSAFERWAYLLTYGLPEQP
jgi:hypothetical protein